MWRLERHAACAYADSVAASAYIMEEIMGKASDIEEMVVLHSEVLKALTGQGRRSSHLQQPWPAHRRFSATRLTCSLSSCSKTGWRTREGKPG